MILTATTDHTNYGRIEKAIQFLYENVHRQPALEEVAEAVHLSPFHFQRIFTEWAGISPKRFGQYLTTDHLKSLLKVPHSIEEAADSVGLSSPSRVYDLFTTLEAVTPQEFRLQGAGLQIRYGFHHTPFGYCLIAVTRRGVCWLSFLEGPGGEAKALQEMTKAWGNAAIAMDVAHTAGYIDRIFSAGRSEKLHVLVKGTNFQVKVWEALLRIPPGAVTTYQEIARAVGSPRATQAVGSAVGSNAIAYLIPCHRVIRKDGILGPYRWSAVRKQSMLGWEMARYGPNNH